MKTSFHKSNLGSFGENLPCDLAGFVHTTQKGWMGARMDAMAWRGYTLAEKREMIRDCPFQRTYRICRYFELSETVVSVRAPKLTLPGKPMPEWMQEDNIRRVMRDMGR